MVHWQVRDWKIKLAIRYSGSQFFVSKTGDDANYSSLKNELCDKSAQSIKPCAINGQGE